MTEQLSLHLYILKIIFISLCISYLNTYTFFFFFNTYTFKLRLKQQK